MSTDTAGEAGREAPAAEVLVEQQRRRRHRKGEPLWRLRPNDMQRLERAILTRSAAEDAMRNAAAEAEDQARDWWEDADEAARSRALEWARSLTQTNCYWLDYEIGQRFIALATPSRS